MAKTSRNLVAPDKIQILTFLNVNQVKLPAGSYITIGNIQYLNTSDLILTTSTTGVSGIDQGSILPNSLYYVYAVLSGNNISIIGSLNTSAPIGYTSYKLVGYFDTNSSSQVVVASNKLIGAVGEVKSAMLSEASFQAQNGPGWILADGRDITGSKHALLSLNNSAPDARGLILRGRNDGGSALGTRADGKQNPDGTLALGAFQDHLFSQHNHGGGSHQHNVRVSNYLNDPNGAISPKGNSPYNYDHPGTLTDIPNVTVIQFQGGNETRMRNITTNHFLKIN